MASSGPFIVVVMFTFTSGNGTSMDSRGTRLIEPIDVPFPDVKVNITTTMNGPDDAINDVVQKLRHHCAVSKMLQMSGSQVTENWVINGADWASAA